MLFYGILALTLAGSIINNTFFAGISKDKPILSVAVYRSICISILLFPLLFFADLSKITSSFLIASIVLGLIGAAGFFFQLKATRYLPIGIVGALRNLYNIGILVFSYFIFGENLSILGYLGAAILLFSLGGLGLLNPQKSDKNHNYKRGLFYVFLRILTLISWVAGFVYFSREVDPYLAIYLSEFTVLLGFIPFVIYHLKTSQEDIMHVFNKQESIKFLLMCCLPAFFSFGLFYASTIGNPSIVTLTLSTSSIFIALVSWFFYKEKLTILQWSMIAISIVGLIMINL